MTIHNTLYNDTQHAASRHKFHKWDKSLKN